MKGEKSRPVLRDVEERDVEIFFEYQSDEVSVAMVGLPSRDREAHFTHWAKLLADNTIVNKAIELDGQVVGNIGCWQHEGKRLVGYFVARSHWGKGIATTALRELLNEVKERPLFAHVATHNVASTRVLEKCGFTIVEGSLNTGDDGIEEALMKLEPLAT